MTSSAASRPTLLHWAEADYWRESRRPLTSLAFILPALGIYEIGVLLLGTRAMRNGADLAHKDLLAALALADELDVTLPLAAMTEARTDDIFGVGGMREDR